VFGPQAEYERVGDADKVVFHCGWVAHGDELRVYYGRADSCIALAYARVPELLDRLRPYRGKTG
jgi:beta-1,4-mannooligosaccharide/beta-1,4-mannosyl-N-acetylglucosamine phosphorylase